MPLGLVSASSLNVSKSVLAPVSYDGSIVLMWNGMLEMREVSYVLHTQNREFCDEKLNSCEMERTELCTETQFRRVECQFLHYCTVHPNVL